jgi:hypothetical protein
VVVQVRVRHAFEFEGRQLAAGDTLTISPVTAAVLHRRGHISLTKVSAAKVATLEAEPPVTVVNDRPAQTSRRGRGRGTYTRRDVVTKD